MWLKAPTEEELAQLTTAIALRIARSLGRQCMKI
jgi:hypothetical protein